MASGPAPTSARGQKIGTLFMNPGGPGASGMSFAAMLQARWDICGLEKLTSIGSANVVQDMDVLFAA